MKATVATSLIAFFGLREALACNKLGCEMLAEELGISFSTAASVDGAPAGCVKFKNSKVIWVESCNSEEDCDPSTCNKCKLVNQQCAGKTYTFNEGATCLEGYYPIATRWEDCRDAAVALGLPDRATNDVDLEFPWGSTKPKGCFRDGTNSKIYFNRGEGGGFSEGDRILCQNFDAGSTTPEPTPKPTPESTPAPTPTPLLGLNGKCWDASKTMEERDATCAGDLVCARKEYDDRDFGGCTTDSDGNYVAGPPYKHHCCSTVETPKPSPEPTPKPTPAPTPTPLLGLNGKCWDASKTMEERDATCAGDLVCARAGFDDRSFGGCTTDSDGNYVAGPPYKHHCCSRPIVKLCEHDNLKGVCCDLGEGEFNVNSKDCSLGNDKLSSVKVSPGCSVTLKQHYSNHNDGGKKYLLDGSKSGYYSYKNGDFPNDDISSVVIECGAHTYTLRGSTGEELVRINQDSNVLLSKEEKLFKTSDRVVFVEFTNDAHSDAGDRNVFLESDIAHAIVPSSGQVLRNWNGGWKCDTSGESERCDMVRKGVLAWQGTYKIIFSGASSTRRMEQTNNIARRLLGYEDAAFRL